MRVRCGSALLSLLALLASARSAPAQAPRGLLILVSGVGGYDTLQLSAPVFLPRAGVDHEIVNFVWTHGMGRLFLDLQDTEHMLRKAEELADLIRRRKQAEPDRPIFLIAKSGGAGLALRAAERLPAGTLERIVLLAAAVSPGYDLRPALRATRGQIVCFYSRNDRLILGWGTSTFGTIDRHYGPAAGLTGFRVPDDLSDADRALYARLVQIPWQPRMFWQGHAGTHSGASAPAFLTEEVAPWLRIHPAAPVPAP